jgi:hypothetical protein
MNTAARKQRDADSVDIGRTAINSDKLQAAVIFGEEGIAYPLPKYLYDANARLLREIADGTILPISETRTTPIDAVEVESYADAKTRVDALAAAEVERVGP